jgi:U6 snRNA-associated Sm-like protein LSm2
MLFYSFFKTLIGKQITVELKNDLCIMGTLHSVDQYLNLKLTDVSTQDEEKYPHLMSVKTCFIRGSVVRYVHINKADVNIELLQDSARVEAKSQKEAVSKVP